MPKTSPKRKPRTREQQLVHLHGALSKLVVLAEAAAELHVAASSAAMAIAEVVEELDGLMEAKPRR